MNRIKIFIVLIILSTFSNNLYGSLLEIKIKIQNQIITNLDIENEKNYLFFLNPKLRNLEQSRINNIAKESLITEIIKKNELKKFFEFNIDGDLLNVVEKNLYKRKNIKNKSEFLKILKNRDLDYEVIKEKLYFEALWNQLIYQKYSTNVILDKDKLRKNILDQVTKEKTKFSYNLSEIFFTESIEETLDQKILKISKSIKKIGFENTANIYSISNTSNKGGLIGWINELQISNVIGNEIKSFKVDEVSKAIKLQNGYIIIKLNDKKVFNQKINVDDQLKKLINNETNRQLNNFSTILYKRLKKNIDIDEY